MSAVEELRTPPFSMEAEEAVIGGLLIDNEAWDKIKQIVTEEDFFRKEHREIFRVIDELANVEAPFDTVTVSEQLKRNKLSTPNTLSHLASLAHGTPSSANIEYYAKIVLNESIRRRLIKVANGIIENSSQKTNRDAQDLLDEAEEHILGIAKIKETQSKEFKMLGPLSSELYEIIEERSHHPERITGLATGFKDFDDKTLGLQKGDLIIIAGRPSMGKTSLALNFASHIAIEEKVNAGPIAIFSMEMNARDLALRFYSALSSIDQQSIRRGRLESTDYAALQSAMSLMHNMNIFIDDSSVLTPRDINARVRRLRKEHGGLSVIIVDYMQLMHFQGAVDNRVDEISKISRSLKAIAREMDVPVIALSQLNRAVESRADKRPQMADLRESGAIEQDADLIVFIYREEQYNKDTEEKGVAEINVAKHRNGPVFLTKLLFKGEYSRFDNYLSERDYAAMVHGMPESDQGGAEDVF